MVLPGQYLERSVAVESGGLWLDGLFHRGARPPPVLIAPPHPALGGSMSAPPVAELAWSLTRAGHATLRFDWRGVGASQGAPRHPAGSLGPGRPRLAAAALAGDVGDLLAAAELLVATAGDGLCVVGYSFGAAVALAAARDPRVARLALVAPPTAAVELDVGALVALGKPALVVAAHHDPLCDARALAVALEERVALEVIPHADHSFRRGLTELGRVVRAWLDGAAPAAGLELDHAAAWEPEPDAPELELPESDEPPLELDE